jgi:hypothetical protein
MSNSLEHVERDLIDLIHCRYRQTPSFSHAVIRRFTNNVSEMKKLAARDYEDLLQCSIPAFEDLLDETHNKELMKLLYRTAEWHALAKLRMHTDTTLEHLRRLTKEFGSLMRRFRDQTCSKFDTVDLPREVAARNRNQQRGHPKVSTKGLTSDGPEGPSSVLSHQLIPSSNAASSPEGDTMRAPSSRKPKTINLSTTKFHFLGDYVRTIQQFGCTDSFSTQLVRHSSLR